MEKIKSEEELRKIILKELTEYSALFADLSKEEDRDIISENLSKMIWELWGKK